MTDQTIKIEDLTPGTVVELSHLTVRFTAEGKVYADCIRTGRELHFFPDRITRIISRPETDADKIARLERELAERDARIAELEGLVRQTTEAIAPAPTTPVWSDPIEGPPPKGLPAGSYGVKFSEHGGWTEGGTPSDGIYKSTGIRHRIAMNQPIKWDGGERPVPGDWEVEIKWSDGDTVNGRADMLTWGGFSTLPPAERLHPVSFTLTSTGGGNG